MLNNCTFSIINLLIYTKIYNYVGKNPPKHLTKECLGGFIFGTVNYVKLIKQSMDKLSLYIGSTTYNVSGGDIYH